MNQLLYSPRATNPAVSVYSGSEDAGKLVQLNAAGLIDSSFVPVTSVNGMIGAVTITLPSASTTAPVMDGTAAIGNAITWAKADHVHPTDTTRLAASLLGKANGVANLDANGYVPSSQLNLVSGVSSVNGLVGAVTLSIPSASTTAPVMDGTATIGTGTTWARADHIHPTDTSRAPLASPTFTGTVTAPLFSGSGASLSLGTVLDSYTIQNLGTVTAAQAIDTTKGRYVKMTLGAAQINVIISNGSSTTATEKLILEVTQDNTGSRVIYWEAQQGFASGVAPILSTAAGATDIIEFIWTGTYWMLTNFTPNIVTSSTLVYGVRPTTSAHGNIYYPFSSVTNPAYAYDGGTSAGIEITTYAKIVSHGISSDVDWREYRYYGMSGLTKSGSLFVKVKITGTQGACRLDYSINSGSSWTTLLSSTSRYDGVLSVALSNQDPSKIWVRVVQTGATTFGWLEIYIYDIVFI